MMGKYNGLLYWVLKMEEGTWVNKLLVLKPQSRAVVLYFFCLRLVLDSLVDALKLVLA